MPLQCWEPTFEGQQPMTEREVERLREYIPPGEVRDLVSNREAAMAEVGPLGHYSTCLPLSPDIPVPRSPCWPVDIVGLLCGAP